MFAKITRTHTPDKSRSSSFFIIFIYLFFIPPNGYVSAARVLAPLLKQISSFRGSAGLPIRPGANDSGPLSAIAHLLIYNSYFQLTVRASRRLISMRSVCLRTLHRSFLFRLKPLKPTRSNAYVSRCECS